MEPTEALLVATFDPKNADFVVLGHPDLRFAGEFQARHAGCIVMPQAPRAGEIRCASSSEDTLPRASRPRVISTVPGTVQWPAKPEPDARLARKPEPDAPRNLPRNRRR